jgi:hypothetical protein
VARPDIIHGAVEGMIDEAVLRRLVKEIGATAGTVYGKNGKSFLLERLCAYNQAARFSPWIILIDLDDDDECAPPFRKSCLPNPAPYLCFRVAVREIESWLLADRERLAKCLSIAVSRIPLDPEKLASPKSTMVELARHSRRRDIREDMVPRPGSGRKVGPAYTAQLIEFARDSKRGWRPDVAAEISDSLNRCVRCMLGLIRAAE